MLVCPHTHQPLQSAPAHILAAVNQAIAQGQLRNLKGEVIPESLRAALITEDGTRLYPIIRGVADLLTDEAIELNP